LNNAVVGNNGQVINRLFESKSIRLTISLPVYDLKRAAVFVGTVNELIEDETDKLFTIEQLISILYEDFLRQVEQGMDLDTLAEAIERKMNEFKKAEMKVYHYLSDVQDDLKLNDLKRQFKEKKQVHNEQTYFQFRILKKYVLKGEVILHDLNELYPRIQLSVEELIALRFKDVMKQIKAGDYRILTNIVRKLTD
jgi:hypothetical protein